MSDMAENPRVTSFWVTDPVDDGDPLGEVKRRAAWLCDENRLIRERADAVERVAGPLAAECLDPEATLDAADAAHIPADVQDSAGAIVVALNRIEHGPR